MKRVCSPEQMINRIQRKHLRWSYVRFFIGMVIIAVLALLTINAVIGMVTQ